MQAALERKEWTDEALMALPRDGQKYELLGGELAVSPTGFQHGYISSRLLAALLAFALEHRLGVVVDSSTGFRMKSGDCLSPDVSFVGKERLRGQKQTSTKFFQGAPDLVVEVVSPAENQRKLEQRLAQYFAEGTRAAWVVNPKKGTVSVWGSPGHSKILREGEQLDGGRLLPGFRFPIKELFEMPDFDS
jgi:Uma2 family endonuclease